MILIITYFLSLIIPAFLSVRISKTNFWNKITFDAGPLQTLLLVVLMYFFLAMIVFILLSPLLKL